MYTGPPVLELNIEVHWSEGSIVEWTLNNGTVIVKDALVSSHFVPNSHSKKYSE